MHVERDVIRSLPSLIGACRVRSQRSLDMCNCRGHGESSGWRIG